MPAEFSHLSNSTAIDRLPPQNIEAEQSVLGSLMLDKDAIIKVADLLKVGDFYRGSHNAIYEVILDLYQKGEPVDLLSAANRLEEIKKLEDIGGTSYLAELINAVPASANVFTYAKIVHRKKILRDLISASYHIAQLGYNENEETDNLLDQAQQKIFGISQRSLQQNFLPVKSVLEEAFERLDKLHQGKGAFRGLPTGFSDLDNHLAGLQKSDLIVLASRPSMGKTSMALDIARHVAVKEKIPVGIFSLEMSKHDLVDRFLSAEGGVNLWKLRTGKLSSEGFDNDFLKIQRALGTLSEAPIFIDDSASPTVLQMRTMARRLQAEEKLGLLIVDYLQLIQPSSAADSEVRQLTEISRSLKSLARELEVPVLAISQFSRAPEARPDQMPRLSDLRGSGSIEQDADVVMFIYREDRIKKDSERQNIADIIIAKHRNGPIGTVELYFDETRASFKTLEKHSFE
jgi:replicative DNA helicase